MSMAAAGCGAERPGVRAANQRPAASVRFDRPGAWTVTHDRPKSCEAIRADLTCCHQLAERRAQLVVCRAARRAELVEEAGAAGTELVEDAAREERGGRSRVTRRIVQRAPRLELFAYEQRNRGGTDHLRRSARDARP
jgi:hypothetical protein